MQHTFTEEQSDAIHSQSRMIIVNALAGTGKTTMAEGYAAHRPNS